MIGILGAKDEFQVYILVKVSIHGTFKSNVCKLGWTARVSSNILELLVAFDFYPTSGSQCSSHCRVTNRNTEVFLAFLWLKCLIKRLRFRCFRASVSLVVLNIIRIIIIDTVIITIETLINASIIVT